MQSQKPKQKFGFFMSQGQAFVQARGLALGHKKSPFQGLFWDCFGGERGIRTPGPVTVNGFQDRRIRPLCHLSGSSLAAWPQKECKNRKIIL
jgi:hypothetical protein